MDNLLSKLSHLHIVEKSFTPEGSKDPIVYNVAVLTSAGWQAFDN